MGSQMHWTQARLSSATVPLLPRSPGPQRPNAQTLRVVEDILYAPSQEEGERILGEAMADLEAQGLAAPAPAGDAPNAEAAEAAAAEAAPEGDAAAAGEAGMCAEGSGIAVGAAEVGCSA